MNQARISEEVCRRLHDQLLGFLPERLADELVKHLTTATYAKNSLIFLQGSSADLMFWVLTGLVKLYRPTPHGDRTLVRICGPGELVGNAELMDSNGQRWQAFEAQAMTKCTLALITREHVSRTLLTLDKPDLILLMERLNTSWSSITDRFATFLALSFRKRLEFVFRDLAARLGVEDNRGILLPMKLSHADLAEMIHGSRPMVTKLIGEMIIDRVLDRESKQYVVPTAAVVNRERRRHSTPGAGSPNSNPKRQRSADVFHLPSVEIGQTLSARSR